MNEADANTTCSPTDGIRALYTELAIHPENMPPSSQRTPLDILNERFARGEIDKAEYEEKRRFISQG